MLNNILGQLLGTGNSDENPGKITLTSLPTIWDQPKP